MVRKGKSSKGEPSRIMTEKEKPSNQGQPSSPARLPSPHCFVYTHDQLRHAPAATRPDGVLQSPFPQPFQKPDMEMPPLGTAPLPIPPPRRKTRTLEDDLPHRYVPTFTPPLPTADSLRVRKEVEEMVKGDEPWRRNPIVVDGSGMRPIKPKKEEKEEEDWDIIDALMSGCDMK